MSDIELLEWEVIERITFNRNPDSRNYHFSITERAKVFGGWLVRSRTSKQSYAGEISRSAQGVGAGIGLSNGEGIGLTFIPDPNYHWYIQDNGEDYE